MGSEAMLRAETARMPIAGDPAPADKVELDYDARYLRRRVLETASGVSLLVDLAEATDLAHGFHMICTPDIHVAVVAAAEPLLDVRAGSAAALGRIAWHVGNRHTPCQIEDDRLLIRQDHVLEAMLTGLGASVARVTAPFQPEGGAYGHGRVHGHSHSHDPREDPNAHIPHRHG